MKCGGEGTVVRKGECYSFGRYVCPAIDVHMWFVNVWRSLEFVALVVDEMKCGDECVV